MNGIENHRRVWQFIPVKLVNLLALLLAVAFFAGCKKTKTAVAPSADNSLPTQAQPKLTTMKIYLGAETLDAELAVTEREEMTGMMFRTNLTDLDAMLFVLPVPQQTSFWMKNCPESLSAAYIGPDGVIEEIHHLEQEDTNSVVSTNGNIQYVLEVKDGWFARHNINPGTEIRAEKGSLGETFFGR
ncbi:MAG: DUF192 domain-containing protein [Verrucomicrobiota bacterium]|jgi:uncharacterized membrane protein (UPF0127 family)